MGRIVVTEFVSLDGIFEDPHEWHFPFFGDAAGTYKDEELQETDALLFGRVTWELMASAWPERAGDPFADRFNAMPKHVVGSSLDGGTWNNSHLVEGDLAAAVADLKTRYDNVIAIHGSGTLANGLLRLGLIDEIRLMVHPVVVGRGRPFFAAGTAVPALALVETRDVGNGVMVQIWRPTEPPAAG